MDREARVAVAQRNDLTRNIMRIITYGISAATTEALIVH